ncbi:MAG: XTP/dITP diphosphatase [Candidatus Helarchaeota archaeon]
MDENIIFFATGNDNKYKEARDIFKKYDIQVEKFKIERLEIQDDDAEKIAKFSLKMIENPPKRIFIEDSGLQIKELNLFPGPYSSYVYKTIGNEGILKLLEGKNDRSAVFYSVIAYKGENETIHSFKGETKGKISRNIRKGKGWGFDPIFIPNIGGKNELTYAELGFNTKNQLSHRSKSFRKLIEFLLYE